METKEMPLEVGNKSFIPLYFNDLNMVAQAKIKNLVENIDEEEPLAYILTEKIKKNEN